MNITNCIKSEVKFDEEIQLNINHPIYNNTYIKYITLHVIKPDISKQDETKINYMNTLMNNIEIFKNNTINIIKFIKKENTSALNLLNINSNKNEIQLLINTYKTLLEQNKINYNNIFVIDFYNKENICDNLLNEYIINYNNFCNFFCNLNTNVECLWVNNLIESISVYIDDICIETLDSDYMQLTNTILNNDIIKLRCCLTNNIKFNQKYFNCDFKLLIKIKKLSDCLNNIIDIPINNLCIFLKVYVDYKLFYNIPNTGDQMLYKIYSLKKMITKNESKIYFYNNHFITNIYFTISQDNVFLDNCFEYITIKNRLLTIKHILNESFYYFQLIKNKYLYIIPYNFQTYIKDGTYMDFKINENIWALSDSLMINIYFEILFQ
jgi:hypothetical protein